MTRTLMTSFLTLCTIISLGCTPKADNPEKMLAEAEALDERFIEALNKQDIDALMATYWDSADLVSYPPDTLETRGWIATKKSMQKMFMEMKGAKVELTESSNKVAGDVVIGWGKWRMAMPVEGADLLVMNGRYVDVKAKREGKWVYILDHASVPIPPPPPKPVEDESAEETEPAEGADASAEPPAEK